MTNEPLVDAAFYVLFVGQSALARFPNAMTGEAFPNGLTLPVSSPDNEGRSFTREVVPDWLAPNASVLKRIVDPDMLSKAWVDVSVRADVVGNVPDIFMVKTPIFSDRAKAVLESFSEDIAYFYPAHLTDAGTGGALPGRYWACLPKFQVFSSAKPNFEAPQYSNVDGPCGRYLAALHWVSGALDYLSDTYPMLDDFGDYLPMGPLLFRTLKAAGLTGLDEVPPNARERIATRGEIYDANREFVSHVHWSATLGSKH